MFLVSFDHSADADLRINNSFPEKISSFEACLDQNRKRGRLYSILRTIMVYSPLCVILTASADAASRIRCESDQAKASGALRARDSMKSSRLVVFLRSSRLI